MLPIRNRLIFGMIKKIILTLLKSVYSIINFFNLQLALLVFLVGLVFYFTGATSNPTIKLIFDGAFILSVVLAIFLTIKRLLGIGKEPKKSKGVQVVNIEQPVPQEAPAQVESAQINNFTAPEDRPTYYRVKGNSNCVMAEYPDRYELFLITPNGLKKIRTDYKK